MQYTIFMAVLDQMIHHFVLILKKICENSFSFCYSLASFVIPESSLLETIEDNVFFDSGIKILTVSSSRFK